MCKQSQKHDRECLTDHQNSEGKHQGANMNDYVLVKGKLTLKPGVTGSPLEAKV